MPTTDPGSAEAMLDTLKSWVLEETPTTDPAAVNRLIDRAQQGLDAAGANLTRIPGHSFTLCSTIWYRRRRFGYVLNRKSGTRHVSSS